MTFAVEIGGESVEAGRRAELAEEFAAELRKAGVNATIGPAPAGAEDKGGFVGLAALVMLAAIEGAAAGVVHAVVRASVPHLRRIPGLVFKVRTGSQDAVWREDDVGPGQIDATIARTRKALETGGNVERWHALIVANGAFGPESEPGQLSYALADGRKVREVLTARRTARLRRRMRACWKMPRASIPSRRRRRCCKRPE